MIIIIGFPKSGTSSFQYLFNKLGIKSYHWSYEKERIGTLLKKNKEQNKLLLSFIPNSIYENCAITQLDVCINGNECYWPQITDYKQLYEENKDAVFILNKRDPIKILNSFKITAGLDKRLIKYNPELFIGIKGITNDEKIINLIINHYNNIETFFKKQYNSKFIIYNIEYDKINKLNKYIDTKNMIFPYKNKGIY